MGKGLFNNTLIAVNHMKLRITKLNDQWWLISQKRDGKYKKVGGIKPQPNLSTIFNIDSNQAILKQKVMGNKIKLTLDYNDLIFSCTIIYENPSKILIWKNNESNKRILDCTRTNFLLLSKSKDITQGKITKVSDSFILETTKEAKFHPVILLATLFPLFF